MKPDGWVPWPDEVALAYREAGCWQGRPLGSYLWEWAEQWGERTALVDGARRIGYRELAERADAFAEGLEGLGLTRGDSVLLQLPNRWEFVVATLGCFRLGVVPVMMLPPHREFELSSIGRHVRARALIVAGQWRGCDHEDLAHRVAAEIPGGARVVVAAGTVRPQSVRLQDLLDASGDPQERRRRLDGKAPAPDDVALFLLSGGTTGVPKVIGRTHDDYAYNIIRTADVCGYGPGTVYLTVLPAGHNFPLANPGIFGTLFHGGRVVLLPTPRPAAVFEAIGAERVTATAAVPAVVLRWMEEAAGTEHDLSSLQYVTVGGSVLAPEIAARIGRSLGCRLQQMYGMAEGLICCTGTDAPDEVAHTTQGAPVSPYDELRVVDPDGLPVARGEIGELLTRGPYTPRGYLAAPEQNRLSYTPDGWFRTGDLVRITPEGNVVVCGRVKDLINRAGEKISAGEIETLAQELAPVAEAAAVAVPDAEVGERVCLFVRVRAGHTLSLADLGAAFTARGVAAFKIPERLELLADIPHTPVGKPDKNALRKRLESESGRQHATSLATAG